MAEERTEAPTPKRKEEVRKRGQTARSQDLTTAIVLLAGLYTLKLTAGLILDRLSALLVGHILAAGALDKTAARDPGASGVGALAAILPPLLGMLAFAAVAASVLQGGFMFVPGLLTPRWERVNPILGTKRILSTQGLLLLLKTLAKFLIVAAVATSVIRAHLADIAALGATELTPALALLLNLAWELLLKSTLAMLALAILDWLWERRRFLQSVRMTKREVQEELRQSEGDPHVRAQQKNRRMRFLQQMMRNVRKADVVVTNPTHYAVALKYDPATMAAPIVLAKGQDYLALKIRQLAADAHVPVVENKPLAKALYQMVPVGKEIPPELYVAVAEVLAFVFRLRREGMAA
ncbi:MAG: flagellar biosynthesis protein FlhB [Chloroflexota bacterium]